MDILKYVDIMIGLAVVMVLLSPVVTAVTQFLLWFCRRRSEYLLEGLQNLILQLQGRPAAIVDIVDGEGNSVPGALAALSPAASPSPVPFVAEIDHTTMSRGQLAATCSGAAAHTIHKVRVTLVPQQPLPAETIVTSATDAAGRTTMTYACTGSPIDASHEAEVVVLSDNGVLVAADLACTVGSNNPLKLNTTATAPARFVYPGAPDVESPARYDVDCTVTSNGNPLANHTLRWVFRRNTQRDNTVSSAPLTGDSPFTATLCMPVITPSRARSIAWAVLTSPMIAKGPTLGPPLSWLPPFRNRCGECIEREELIRLLLELATSEGAPALKWPLPPEDRDALRATLRMNGIADPSRSLNRIRKRAQELEHDEPATAACVRQAKAIVAGAQSDFVGKINNWFDQTMTRVTQRYAASARAVTVLAALVVAVGIQFDALELLRRLSADDKFRASLLNEAKAQQERADSAKTATTSDEIETAKAKRNEIDATLAKLRAPELAILPNRYVWQRPSEARLPRNPLWTVPYPARFELVAGGNTYQILPRWQDDVLTDLKAAIDGANATVTTSLTEEGKDLILTATRATAVQICARSSDSAPCVDLARTIDDVAQAEMALDAGWPTGDDPCDPILIVGDEPAVSIKFDHASPRTLSALHAAIVAARPKATVRIDGAAEHQRLVVRAMEPRVRRIRLVWRRDDPFSNVLTAKKRVPRAWRVEDRDLNAVVDKTLRVQVETSEGMRTLDLDPSYWAPRRSIDLESLADAINDFDTAVIGARHSRDTLTLRASGVGPLELRFAANQPKTNILNVATAAPWTCMATLLQPHLIGIVTSWVLLSLGAPFWYDMLKNLLKLRPAPAIAEEKQRDDRAKENTAPKNG